MTCGDTWHLGISRATAHPTCGQFELGGDLALPPDTTKYKILRLGIIVADTQRMCLSSYHACNWCHVDIVWTAFCSL